MAIFKQGTALFEQQQYEMEHKRYKTFREMFFRDDDKGTKVVAFLHDDPIQFLGHTVKDGNRFDNYVCGIDDDDDESTCALCDSGSKQSLFGAYLVYVEQSGTYKNKDGKTVTRTPEVQIWLIGARKMGAIQTLRARCKDTLRGFMCDIVRTGHGQQTTYAVFKNEDADYPDEDEIRTALPEKVRDKWRGNEKSTYKVLTDALLEYSQYDNDSANVSKDDDDAVVERPQSKPKFKKKVR